MASRQKDLVPFIVSEMSKTGLEDVGTEESYFNLPDHLVAKVLGYLPLKDRFSLEMVCRQWQRCIFLRVEHLFLYFYYVDQKYTLEINDVGLINSSRIQELSAVLQKLRISTVGHLECVIGDRFSDHELLVLLAKIARFATKVDVTYHIISNPTNLVTFCDIIGPHVTTFTLCQPPFQELPENIQMFVDAMAKMKQLKGIFGISLGLIFTCLTSLPANSLPQFHAIEVWSGTDCDWRFWQDFKSLYGEKIKKFTFFEVYLPFVDFPKLRPLKEILPFVNLDFLEITYGLDYLTAFAKDLEDVTKSCPLLTTFHLGPASKRPCKVSLMAVQKLFTAIGKMKKLVNLGLYLYLICDELENVSSEENLNLFALLENKSSITHLMVCVKLWPVSSPHIPLRRGVYGSLSNVMPNMKHLNAVCLASELDHFAGFNKLRAITLDFILEESSESIQDGVIHILRNSPALEIIEVEHKLAEVSHALIATIIEVAELQMEKHIDFIAKIGVLNKSQEAWNASKHLAPRNLTVILDDEESSY